MGVFAATTPSSILCPHPLSGNLPTGGSLGNQTFPWGCAPRKSLISLRTSLGQILFRQLLRLFHCLSQSLGSGTKKSLISFSQLFSGFQVILEILFTLCTMSAQSMWFVMLKRNLMHLYATWVVSIPRINWKSGNIRPRKQKQKWF